MTINEFLKEQIDRDKAAAPFTPTGFTFLTNKAWGVNSCNENATSECQRLIAHLRNIGYDVQVSLALDYKGRAFATPTFNYVAIYVKKLDGGKIDVDACFNYEK